MPDDQSQPQPDNTADLTDALADIRQRLGSLPEEVAQTILQMQGPEPVEPASQQQTGGSAAAMGGGTPIVMPAATEGYASLPLPTAQMALSSYLPASQAGMGPEEPVAEPQPWQMAMPEPFEAGSGAGVPPYGRACRQVAPTNSSRAAPSRPDGSGQGARFSGRRGLPGGVY